jgi:hypothetical protein
MNEHKTPLNLKPIRLTATSGDKRGTAPIFAAGTNDDSDSFGFAVRKPLQWWYKASDDKHWKEVPGDALVTLEENNRVVRMAAERLERPEHGACTFQIAVTEDAKARPAKDAANVAEYDAGALVPVTPFRIDGHGSNGHHSTASVEVSMSRTKVPTTKDEILWIVIRNSTNALGFKAYHDFMDALFADPRFISAAEQDKKAAAANSVGGDTPPEAFAVSSMRSFDVLRAATELFVMTRCGVVRPPTLHPNPHEEEARFGHRLGHDFEELWERYLVPAGNMDGRYTLILPYLDLIRRKLGDIGAVRTSVANIVDRQAGLLQDKLVHPVLLELIWSYWMEEGMLVQGFNAITRRFQNLRANGERDPLAQLEIDPLRPVNNLLWGWVQDEQSRLSVLRRAHEYDHQYGFTLHGKAVAELRTMERRSKFLESFHNLLWRCTQFYRQDDDTTVIADGFAVLNALKETHYLLAQGAHNQFSNLSCTARQEMLMQQWILARPEVREFLGSRVMVPYPEPWMDRVDSIKTLKGWTDTSVVHFRDLATFGEQLLLAIRWGAWSTVNDPNSAANWARYWRPEVQGYIHGYRAATSVDLTADITDQRQADTRFLAPSVHLRNRLVAQAQTAR